jgi:hypothetical protein
MRGRVAGGGGNTLPCVVPDAQARSGDAGAGVTLPAAVHANTQARNAGTDANTALPEVQADAGKQFHGAVEAESHIRIDCSGKRKAGRTWST